jgi:hypothetical protein
MVDSDESSSSIFLLRTEESNKICVDCNIRDSEIAETVHAIFLCEVCAIAHQCLPKERSNIKALDAEWSFAEVYQMAVGGNSALRDFFSYYSLLDTPIAFKYCTRAAAYYRRLIRGIAESSHFDEDFPSINDGQACIIAEDLITGIEEVALDTNQEESIRNQQSLIPRRKSVRARINRLADKFANSKVAHFLTAVAVRLREFFAEMIPTSQVESPN